MIETIFFEASMHQFAYFINWLALTLLWMISLRIKDSSIIDIYWGFGFVLIAWACSFHNYMNGLGSTDIQEILLVMVTIWGLRLTYYLARRNLGHGEDYRYVKMRNASKRDWRLVSYFRVFMLQGVLQAIISWPIFLSFSLDTNKDSSALVAFAIIFFIIGFLFESIADQQMKKFKSDPNNSSKIMNKGLWKYSRHPNYFGDFLQWFAIFVLSLSTGSFLGAVAPAMMLFIFFKLTIRLLEKPQSKKRPGYNQYIDDTNMFFPGPRSKKD